MTKWISEGKKPVIYFLIHFSEIDFLACIGSVLGLVSYKTKKSGIYLRV